MYLAKGHRYTLPVALIHQTQKLQALLTIALEQARFRAFHGLYAEEQIIGTDFLVDIQVQIPGTFAVEDLSDTVNYEGLYAIARTVMALPQPLLEQVVLDISDAIKTQYPEVQHSIVTLRKVNPPLGGEVRHSMVALEKNY